jgi:hypothetical protein
MYSKSKPMKLKIQKKPKAPKQSPINNYKVAYLDKSSKTYHRVYMSAFVGLFGFVGVLYIFGSKASAPEAASELTAVNAQQVFLDKYGILLLLALLGVVLLLIIFLKRKK